MHERVPRAPVEWGVAARCRPGEATSGDLGVVALTPAGALVAGIDGLGHGSEAAVAARRAGDLIGASPSRDLVRLVERCHLALAGTRGAAVSVAFISAPDGGMTWLGVGNVAGRVLSGDRSATRPKGSLALAGGILGHALPALEAATVAVRPGDVVLLATDGIDTDFADAPDTSGSPQAISERILAAHAKASDDALVLAVRYLGVRA